MKQSNAQPPQLQWLYSRQMFGIKLGLQTMWRLLADWGNPQERLKFLHVAGTNGKGSTCSLLASALRQAGYRTGLFTSPHLIHFRERMQVNGVPITEKRLYTLLEDAQELVRQADPAEQVGTFFELTTAMALRYFAEEKCDIVVLETGMGGRLDATNVVTPLVSVLTRIGLDHQQWLGETLGQIAAEKAGIIKPQVPVISSPQAAEALRVIEQVAEQNQSPLHVVTEPWSGELGLAGPHQRWNAAVAAAALEMVRGKLPVLAAAISSGFAQAEWPCRFQKIRRWVLDGAHNADGATVLAQSWREVHGSARATVLFGAVGQKDISSMLAEILPLAERIIVTPMATPRSLTPEILVQAVVDAWRELQPQRPLSIQIAPNVATGRKWAEEHPGPLLCVGSLYLGGEMLSLLQEEFTFEASLQ